MQEPGSLEGSLRPQSPQRGRRRQRRKRTVYSREQREELEKFFESNRYPTYEEREALAATLNLQEHQVQVWFKNRRAKLARPLRPTKQQGPEASASTQGPGIAAGPVYPILLHSTWRGFPAAEPSLLSKSQTCQDLAQNMFPAAPAPGQGVQNMVAAAPVPAPAPSPVWAQGPDASYFSPDPSGVLSWPELLSPHEPWLSESPEGEESVELTLLQGLEAGTGSQGTGDCTPAPASVDLMFSDSAMFPGGREFSRDSGGGSASPHSTFGGVPASEPSVSSNSQAWQELAKGTQNMVPAARAPAQEVQNMVPVAPAPAQEVQNMPQDGPAPAPSPALSPVWPHHLNDSCFSTSPYGVLCFPELLSPQEPWL